MFKRLINSFIAILVCVVSCSKDPGQNPSGGGLGSDGIMPSGPVTISGRVLDQTGKALEGVVVSDGFKSYKTDSKGVFRIDTFYNIYTSKKEVAYAPGDPSADPFITASVNLNGVPAVLKCFLSLDGTSDYLIDENNKIYTVSSIHTRNFIYSPYAASFYVASVPPVLSSINGDTIQPKHINWNYRTDANKFVAGTSATTSSEILTYDITINSG